jgi:hypothetical protein
MSLCAAQIQQHHNRKYQFIDILRDLIVGIGVNREYFSFASLKRVLGPGQVVAKDPKVDDSEFLILFRSDWITYDSFCAQPTA